jgi:2-polyprenyl-3-methyl-5-hydroxy-6-metoxy-1,4-benzoquinol methylase
MAGLTPSTSERIAEHAGLNERYVREWLGAMVVGKIVDYDPANRTYSLSPEHAAFLTKAAGPDNLAAFARNVSLTAEVEDQVVECFRKGGGVPYSEFEKSMHCIAELTGPFYDKFLIETQLPLVPGLTERLEAGIDVLDVGCGAGHGINVMAARFPKSRFRGYDFLDHSIDHARDEARHLGLANASFEVKDVATIDDVERFDLITAFDSIHDQAKPRTVLRAIHRALRKDGVFFMGDINASSHLEKNIDHPLAPTFYTVSFTHCMTVSLAYGGEGLGTMWGREVAQELLHEAGFAHVEVKEVEGDIMNCYYIATK